jgi:hypothetical protein
MAISIAHCSERKIEEIFNSLKNQASVEISSPIGENCDCVQESRELVFVKKLRSVFLRTSLRRFRRREINSV